MMCWTSLAFSLLTSLPSSHPPAAFPTRKICFRPVGARALRLMAAGAPQKEPTPQKKAVLPERGDTLVLVGLGNPGPRFDGTRHNIGFALMDAFAARNKAGSFTREKRFRADLATVRISDRTVHIVKPTTFMNESGVAANAVMKYYKVPYTGLLVVADDMALEVGRLRLRAKGSAGGHNGLKSVQKNLGSMEYARLKVGVGSPNNSAEWPDHVLGKFSRREQAILSDVEWDAMDVLEHWVREPKLQLVINRLGVAQQPKS